jgi:carboxymethylenebutenolidase
MSTSLPLCSQCTENPPVLNSSCGSGTVEEFAGLKTYITGSESSKLGILLLSDAFGYEAPNLRKLADKVAEAGFFVLVPDFFYGDPVNTDVTKTNIPQWQKKHDTGKGCENARTVIAALKSKGMTAVGAAGFCWGGSVVAKVAKFDDLKAAVVLHPGPLTVDDINQVKIPISILGAEIDEYCSKEEILHLGEVLSAKPQIESFVKIFPGTKHGYALRYRLEDEKAVKIAEEAHSDMLNWLLKYVR